MSPWNCSQSSGASWKYKPDELLSPKVDVISYRRVSHDLARRIAVGEEIGAKTLEPAVQGTFALETLNALLSSLLVEVPGRRKAPRWYSSHFYPFVGELVHYDAVVAAQKPSIERYLFRDGGGWAYHVLRFDPEGQRRETTRKALSELVGDSGSPLGRVALALQTHDSARAESWVDQSEASTKPYDAESPWPGVVAAGRKCHRYANGGTACQAHRESHALGAVLPRAAPTTPCSSLSRHAARSDLSSMRPGTRTRFAGARRRVLTNSGGTSLLRSPTRAGTRHQAALDKGDASQAERWARFTQPNAAFTKSPRAFFSETLAAVGALNSTTGRRHFTFKAPMLEALVAALLEPGEEEEFYRFCQRLHEQLGLVIDDRTARTTGLTKAIDGGVFAVNAEAFKARLAAAGLLTHYSDATSIIHGEPR